MPCAEALEGSRGRGRSQELPARARELREQAAATDIDGYRTGALKLAVRHEQTAAVRLAS
jgi:hypothetical protein